MKRTSVREAVEFLCESVETEILELNLRGARAFESGNYAEVHGALDAAVRFVDFRGHLTGLTKEYRRLFPEDFGAPVKIGAEGESVVAVPVEVSGAGPSPGDESRLPSANRDDDRSGPSSSAGGHDPVNTKPAGHRDRSHKGGRMRRHEATEEQIPPAPAPDAAPPRDSQRILAEQGGGAPRQVESAPPADLQDVLDEAAERLEAGDIDSAELVVAHAAARDTKSAPQAEPFDAAELELSAALEERRRFLGDEHPDTLSAMCDLARLYRNKDGGAGEAETLLRDALSKQRRVFGPIHVEIANTLSQLADLLFDKSDAKGAEQFYREALGLRRRLLGDEHADVADTLNRLAVLLSARGDVELALQYCDEALRIRIKSLGRDDPLTLNSMNNLGILHQANGDYAAAEPLLREALESRRRILGHAHPDVANSLGNLGMLLYATARYDAAEPALRENLATNRKLFGNEHVRVASSMENLARVLEARGEMEPAEELLREAVTMRRKLLGDRHPLVARSLMNLAYLRYTRGDFTGAERSGRRALAIWQHTYGLDDWHTASAESLLGATLCAAGRFAEAEPLLLRGYRKMRAIFGDGHDRTTASLQRIVDLYESCGRADDAAEYLALLPPLATSRRATVAIRG